MEWYAPGPVESLYVVDDSSQELVMFYRSLQVVGDGQPGLRGRARHVGIVHSYNPAQFQRSGHSKAACHRISHDASGRVDKPARSA